MPRKTLVLAALVTACAKPPALTVDVVRGVPAQELRVRIGERGPTEDDRRIELVAIAAASARDAGAPGRQLWVVAHVEGQPYLHPPVTIPYGEQIPGYAASAAPVLPVGEYDVRAIASGVVAAARFRITPQNRVD